MKRVLIAVASLTVAFGMFAGCAAETTPEPTQVLDDAIHEVERALGRYVQIDPNGPAEDVQRATDRVSSAWALVVDAAADVDNADISDAQVAYGELVEAVAEVPEDLSAGEAFAAIEGYVDAFEEAVDDFHDELNVH